MSPLVDELLTKTQRDPFTLIRVAYNAPDTKLVSSGRGSYVTMYLRGNRNPDGSATPGPSGRGRPSPLVRLRLQPVLPQWACHELSVIQPVLCSFK